MPDDMKLPDGSTCADCAHQSTCAQMYGVKSTNTSCDFSPSRFAVNWKLKAEKAEEALKTILCHAGSAIECVDEPGKGYLREICEIVEAVLGPSEDPDEDDEQDTETPEG